MSALVSKPEAGGATFPNVGPSWLAGGDTDSDQLSTPWLPLDVAPIKPGKSFTATGCSQPGAGLFSPVDTSQGTAKPAARRRGRQELEELIMSPTRRTARCGSDRMNHHWRHWLEQHSSSPPPAPNAAANLNSCSLMKTASLPAGGFGFEMSFALDDHCDVLFDDTTRRATSLDIRYDTTGFEQVITGSLFTSPTFTNGPTSFANLPQALRSNSAAVVSDSSSTIPTSVAIAPLVQLAAGPAPRPPLRAARRKSGVAQAAPQAGKSATQVSAPPRSDDRQVRDQHDHIQFTRAAVEALRLAPRAPAAVTTVSAASPAPGVGTSI